MAVIFGLLIMGVPFEIKNSWKLGLLKGRCGYGCQPFAKILGIKVNAH